MFKKLFKLSAICLSLVLVFTLNYNVKAYYSLAEIYTYPNNGTLRDAGPMSQSLTFMGYSPNIYTNVNAQYVRRTMGSDGVFYLLTHGFTGGGGMTCFDSSGNVTSYISAEPSSVWNNYSLQAYFGSNTSAFSNMKLAYWSGCETAKTSSTYGNLLDKSIYYGATAAIGYYNIAYDNTENQFEKQFFYYSNQRNDMVTALNRALTDTINLYGDPAGVDSYVIKFKPGISNAYLSLN